MNPFNHGILTLGKKDIEDLTLRITSGQETSLPSISWFNAYRTSDFSRVVNDKTFFFLYGTNHGGDGAINYGKGNNLDLSDFEEVGQILTGYQAETPALIQVPSEENPDDELLHLFFHTSRLDPGNNDTQQTRLYTSAGGNQLHLNTWTDRGRPLGLLAGENHTGYFMPYRRGVNDWIGTHITRSGLPQAWYYSTATQLRSWTRGMEIDVVSGVKDGFFAQLSEGLYFDYLGQQWWLGNIGEQESSGTHTGATRILVIAKAQSIFGAPIQQDIFINGEFNVGYSVYVENDTAHVYITNPATKLYHGTYDLRKLQNYL